jgi:hypothetical protein
MKGYEYIRLEFDFGDLAELNRLGSAGWKVVAVVPSQHDFKYWALLERDTMDVPFSGAERRSEPR